MENYNKELENNLLEMIRQKELADRRLLTMEIVTGVVCLLPLLAMVIVVELVPMEETLAAVLTLASVVPLLIATPFMLKIEQTAGYYECKNCKDKKVPD